MGLIASVAIILATQTAPTQYHYTGAGGDETYSADSTDPILARKIPQADKARLDEIWNHIDNRIVIQSDIWYELGEFPSCAAILRVQTAYSPDNYDVCTSLGWMLENIDRGDEALTVYREFSDRHPNVGDAVFALGNAYFARKDYKNAIKYLEPSLAKNPSENNYRILAKAYEKDGKPKEAIRIWELELKAYPKELTPIANIKRVKKLMAAGGK